LEYNLEQILPLVYKDLIMSKVAIFSPAAGGNVGHGFIYAYKICNYLKDKNQIQLFTIDDPKKTKEFQASGIGVTLSEKFKAGRINKKRFNKLGILKNLVYGIYRIYYNYRLIAEYYNKFRHYDIFHLFEFEYSALYIFSIFHINLLKRSIVGIHIADFKWITGRPLAVNIYKSLLHRPVSWMLRNCMHSTTHGEATRKLLMNDFSLAPERISSLQYGCEIKIPEISKMDARKEIGLISEKRKIALFFGVFRIDKGLFEVIRSIKNLNKDIVLLIAGSEGNISFSNVSDSIQKEGVENQIHTIFKYFEEDEIKYYYYASDFVLIPHKGEHLAFSGPLSLAVEYCRPVIASDVGEIGTFVRDNKIGVTFRPDDWEDFIQTTFYNRLSDYDESLFLNVQKKNSWDEMGKQINLIYALHLK
jgi:glycosyltransferase involved in cell wall biosynthesis